VEKPARTWRAAFICRRAPIATANAGSELQIGAPPAHTSAPAAQRVFHRTGESISNRDFRGERVVMDAGAPLGGVALLPLLFSKMDQMS
jgi:hypothetical protein